MAWFSPFPNVIEAEFVASLSSRRQADAGKTADRILDRLEENGALKGPRASVRPLIVESLVDAAAERPRE